MSPHTPGPWETSVGRSAESRNVVEWWIVGPAGGDAIAYLDTSQPEAEAQANARLMAAAPDLLAVARAFLALPDLGHTSADAAGALYDYRAAIEKARATLKAAGASE